MDAHNGIAHGSPTVTRYAVAADLSTYITPVPHWPTNYYPVSQSLPSPAAPQTVRPIACPVLPLLTSTRSSSSPAMPSERRVRFVGVPPSSSSSSSTSLGAVPQQPTTHPSASAPTTNQPPPAAFFTAAPPPALGEAGARFNTVPAVSLDGGVRVGPSIALHLPAPPMQQPPAAPWVPTIPLPAPVAGTWFNAAPAVNFAGGGRVGPSLAPPLPHHPMQHTPAAPWLPTIPLPAAGPSLPAAGRRMLPPLPVPPPQQPPPTPWLRTVPLPTPGAGAGFNPHLAVSIDGGVRVEPAIDPILSAPAHPAHPPVLQWDLAAHPDNIRVGRAASSPARDLRVEDLARCAVRAVAVHNGAHGTVAHGASVMLAHITLVFPGLPLMVECAPTNAQASSASPPVLTVRDVLYGLYKALREPVSQAEYDRLPNPHQDAVGRAFWTRITGDPANHDHNMRRGLRYIDYLGILRRFAGIRPATPQEMPAGKRWGEVFVVVVTAA